MHVTDIAAAVEFGLREERTIGRVFNLAETEAMNAGMSFSTLCKNFGVETKDCLKIPTPIFTLFAKVAWRMPATISASPLSWIITREWGKIVPRYNLAPDLKPQFTHDFRPFLNGDHLCSCQAFCDLGFVHEHPNFRKSFPEVAAW